MLKLGVTINVSR